MKKLRKERKLAAKQNGEVFVPQYNGTGVLSFEDYYGVGNERYNSKFVTFNKPVEKVEEEVVNVTEDVLTKEEETIEVIATELVKETPKKKKGKLKKALKKLFNK